MIVGATVSNLGRWRDNLFAVSLTSEALGDAGYGRVGSKPPIALLRLCRTMQIKP